MVAKITKLLFMVGLLLILPLIVSATEYQAHKINTLFDVVIQSDDAIECNLSYIQLDNSNAVITNVPMTKIGQTFNYTLNKNNFTALGDICMGISCSDGTAQTTGSICRKITPSGFINTSTFFFIFIIIIGLIFTMGFIMKNPWILLLGSILVLILGFFIIINGIDIIKDTKTTWAIGIIVWGLAIYFMYLSLEEILKEWK